MSGNYQETIENFVTKDLAYRCGLGYCSPDWLQKLRNVKLFTVCIGLISITQGILVNGVLLSAIQSIEKEFGLSSTQSGLIVAGNDTAALILVGVVSFFGSKSHKPKWIGYGAMITGIGSILFALPKLLIGKYHPPATGGFEYNMCQMNTTWPMQPHCKQSDGADWVHVAIFFSAQLLMGAGTTPLFTLGPAYLDENVDPASSPLYLGTWFATTMLGPGLGFLIGGAFLKIFTNLHTPKGSHIDLKDPRWIGAWWMPFVTLSFILISCGFLLTCFPYEMPEGKHKKQKAIAEGHLPGEDKKMEYSIKGLFKAGWKLIRNKTYIFAVLALSAGMLYLISLASFFAKLLTLKFGVSQFKAGIFIGVVMVPAMMSGTFLGAVFIRRMSLKGSAGKASRLCFAVSLVTLASTFLFAIPGCPNTKMAGVTVNYFNQTSKDSIYSHCNVNCSCSRSQFIPVCGSDGVTYYNPCFAGCTSQTSSKGSARKEKDVKFGGCRCIAMQSNSSSLHHRKSDTLNVNKPVMSGYAKLGSCPRNCKNVIVFLLFLGMLVLIAFLTGTPHKMIIMRAVPDNQRSFALGLSYLIMRIFSFLPGPIIFGAVLDSQCLVWGYDECDERTSCQDYDIDALSWNIVMFGGLTLVPACVLYLLAWKCYSPLPEERCASINSADDSSSVS